ncbi:MAG TPA: hypothetical protein VL728_13715 [Cyclobacteriaceae bacterium]|jgi:hypothetical protein|nr:hypothetical protein [Cyclobacteriaceae bacterium]
MSRDKTSGQRIPANFDQYEEDFISDERETVFMPVLTQQEKKIFLLCHQKVDDFTPTGRDLRAH